MTAPRCPCCTDEGTLTCSGCSDVKYCSRECQEADWQFHKLLCKSVKDFRTPPQPGMFRAVYFPHHGKKPEFRWMNAEPEGPDGRSMSTRYFFENEHTGAHMSSIITVYYDGHSMFHSKYANSAIDLATNRKNAFQWAGPIFALKSRWIGSRGSGLFDDMDMTSYSDLIAYLVQFWNMSATAKLYKAPKVKGVKMYCDGDRKANRNLPRSVPVEIPRIHPIFDNKGYVSDVSRMIGMPLVTRKFATNPHAQKIWGYKCNQSVTYMQVGCDPSIRTDPNGVFRIGLLREVETDVAYFGIASSNWQGGQVPNVFISREQDEYARAYDQEEEYEEEDDDSLPLQSSTVEAFGDFCQHHLDKYHTWGLEQDVLGSKGIDKKRRSSNDRVILDQMTPTVWERYLIQWHAHQAKKAAGVSDHAEDGDGLGDLVDNLAQTDISGTASDSLMGVSARQGKIMLYQMLGIGFSEEDLAAYED